MYTFQPFWFYIIGIVGIVFFNSNELQKLYKSLAMMLSCQTHLAFILLVAVSTRSSSFVHNEKK